MDGGSPGDRNRNARPALRAPDPDGAARAAAADARGAPRARAPRAGRDPSARGDAVPDRLDGRRGEAGVRRRLRRLPRRATGDVATGTVAAPPGRLGRGPARRVASARGGAFAATRTVA